MDAFALLTGGVKFDRNRFAADISRFRPGQAKPAGDAVQPPHAQGQGQGQQGPGHKAGAAKKRKRALNPQQSKAEGPGIDVFVKSKPINQQQPMDSEDDDEEEEFGGSDDEGSEQQLSSDGDQGEQEEEGDSGSLEDEEDEDDEEGEEGEEEGEEEEEEEEGRQAAGSRHTGHDRHSSGGGGGGAGGGDVDPGCPVVATRDVQEAANVVRKHYRIKVSGSDPPAPLRCWRELAASAAAIAASAVPQHPAGNPEGGDHDSEEDAAAEQRGEREEAARHARRAAERLVERLAVEMAAGQPTPIQRQAVPCLMAGRELLAVAPTGSGKTLAFLVPLLLRLKALSRAVGKPGEAGPHGPRALLLSPTHELAAQQARVLRLLLPGSGLKGALLTKATATDNAFTKVDLLLANPLRVANMVAAKELDLSQVRHLILDEADKLFNMGFVTQIDAILAACTHKDITRALFSATLPDKVEQLARSVLSDPLRVTVGARNTAVHSVKQRLMFVGRGESGKLLALRQLLSAGLTPPVLVFVATKERAKALHRELLYDGVRVDSINAAQSHTVRAAAVDNFRAGRTWVLIATDLVGRGMDFIGVRTVVNFDVPESTSDYIHRVGRTGRANQTGEAVSFFTEEDAQLLRPIANIVKEAGGEVPAWMLTLKKVRTKEIRRRRLPNAVAAGATLSTRPSYDMKKRRMRQQGTQHQGKRQQKQPQRAAAGQEGRQDAGKRKAGPGKAGPGKQKAGPGQAKAAGAAGVTKQHKAGTGGAAKPARAQVGKGPAGGQQGAANGKPGTVAKRPGNWPGQKPSGQPKRPKLA